MKLIDPDHPFFRKPLARWATAILPLGWAMFELWMGNPLWALAFGAAGAYALWVLILNRKA